MKIFTKTILILTFLINSFIFAQTYDTLTILYLNDTHSCLSPLGPRDNNIKGERGGIARAASVIGLNQLTEKNLLTLHAGDYSIGDLFFNKYFGVVELKIFDQLKFDALTLGNHEFDLSASNLVKSLDSANLSSNFTLLSSNAILLNDSLPRFAHHIKATKIKQFGNLKVGIFGLTTPETVMLSNPYPVFYDTNLVSIFGTVMALVDSLKAQGCDIVICLSHLGFDYDKVLAMLLPDINIIVGGHDHYNFYNPIEIPHFDNSKTYITQAGAFYNFIGKIKFKIKDGKIQSLLSNELVELNSTIPEEPTTAALIGTLIQDIEATWNNAFYSQPIATATADFNETADSVESEGWKDTQVGNLVTDAFRAKTNTDIAIIAGGSTAQPLYHGPIVFADVYRMLSYGMNLDNGLGFRLITFKMKGSDLLNALAFSISMVINSDEFLLQGSGITYAYNPTKEGLEKLIRESVKIQNQIIDSNKYYTITSNEMLLMVFTLLEIPYLDLVIYPGLSGDEVVAGYILQRSISPLKEGRVKAVIPSGICPENLLAIKSYELKQNYPNPFNPSTVIEYEVSGRQNVVGSKDNVVLKIYDVLGKEIETLVNDQRPAGKYNVQWNASKYPSGVYYYELRAGNFRVIKKMMLTK